MSDNLNSNSQQSSPLVDTSERSVDSSSAQSANSLNASSLPKRRSNGRVARILQHPPNLAQRGNSFNYPIMRNITPTRSLPEKSISDIPFFHQNPNTFIYNTQIPLVGEIINGHICFRLIPNIPKLFCPFSFSHSENHHVVLNIQPLSVTIPFVLNDTPCIFSGAEVDVTDQLHNGENYLLFNTSNISFEVLVSIEWRNSSTPESIVESIIKSYPPMEIPPDMQYITDTCPITNKQIQTPGRGVNCTHARCFDLVAFVKKAQETGDYSCPICHQIVPIETLRYDPSYLKNCGSLFITDDFMEDDAANYF